MTGWRHIAMACLIVAALCGWSEAGAHRSPGLPAVPLHPIRLAHLSSLPVPAPFVVSRGYRCRERNLDPESVEDDTSETRAETAADGLYGSTADSAGAHFSASGLASEERGTKSPRYLSLCRFLC